MWALSRLLTLAVLVFFNCAFAAPAPAPADSAGRYGPYRQMTRSKLVELQERRKLAPRQGPSFVQGDCSNAPSPMVYSGRTFEKDCSTFYYTGGSTIVSSTQEASFLECVSVCAGIAECIGLDFFPNSGSAGQGNCLGFSAFGSNGISAPGAIPGYARAYATS